MARRMFHGFRVLAVVGWLTGGLGSGLQAGLVEPVRVVDLRPLRHLDVRVSSNAVQVWDTLHVMAALQGLVNRTDPRLYLLYCADFGQDTDAFWLEWLRTEDGWLKDRPVMPVSSVVEAVRAFRSEVRGLVVYDPAVPATSSVGSTAAGVERLLPVRYSPDPGSLCAVLQRELALPVELWLVNPDGTSKFTGRGTIPESGERSTGSAKADAYRWALRRYVATGRCDARFVGYYQDAWWLRRPEQGPDDLHTLSNHDYFIARRGFFFDLSPWGDEVPVDDPGQPVGTDRRVFLELLGALADGAGNAMIQVGGFPPWPYKYTTHGGAGKHEGVPTEWEFTRLISQFNAYKEADAASHGSIANASFFQHYPLRKRYLQPNRRPTRADWQRAGWLDVQGRVTPRLYVGHYVGDYDAPSWWAKAVPAFFRDPARGQVPLGWAVNPNLADRMAPALVYAYRHATTNDFFIAGDSGAGYVNPRALTVRPDSRRPAGLERWVEHCRRHYARWDMTLTGFVLDGSAGASTPSEFAAYRRFSPDGCGTHFESDPRLFGDLPTCPERDLPDGAEAAAAFIAAEAAKGQGSPRFLWARSILKPPSWYAAVARELQAHHREAAVTVVDPFTFFGLIREDLVRRR